MRLVRVLATCLCATLAVVVSAGCQVDVAVDVRVDEDASGVVTVGVGLDQAAMARAGDLGGQLRTDDLVAAGWEVTDPEPDAGGLTWVRASKPFADPASFAEVMQEVTGPDGPLRDWELRHSDGLLGTAWEVDGTVDLTGGPAVISDPGLATALGGDPLGGTVADIEAAEGRPVSEMVAVVVTVELPDAEPVVTRTGFAEQWPVTVVAASSRSHWPVVLLVAGVVLGGAVLALVAMRSAFGRRRTA